MKTISMIARFWLHIQHMYMAFKDIILWHFEIYTQYGTVNICDSYLNTHIKCLFFVRKNISRALKGVNFL